MFVCISFMCLRVHVDLIHLWLPEMINVVCFVCLLRSSYKEQTTYDSDLRSAVRGTDRRSKHAYRNCDAMQRKPCNKKVCLQRPTSADNVALAPAFAAARRVAARLLLTAGLTAVQQSIDISWPPAHSSKPAAVACGGRGWNERTDGRTDARQQHRPRSAYYAGSANNTDEIINKYNLNLYVISIDWFSRSETQQIMYTQYDIIHVHRVSKKAMTFYILITRSKINDCNKYVSILVFRIGM